MVMKIGVMMRIIESFMLPYWHEHSEKRGHLPWKLLLLLLLLLLNLSLSLHYYQMTMMIVMLIVGVGHTRLQVT